MSLRVALWLLALGDEVVQTDVSPREGSTIRLIVPVQGIRNEDQFREKLHDLLLAHPATAALGLDVEE